MKTTAQDVRRYFRPLMGSQAWRVKLGVGSFLTFEFGPRTKFYGHVHGKWHLWVYLSNWELFHGKRELADSDMDRKVITPAVRRLEEVSFTDVKFDSRTKKTRFLFDDFLLLVSPADYLDEITDRDAYWIFFMPDGVLTMGPTGLRLEQRPDTIRSHRQQEGASESPSSRNLLENRRAVRLQD